MWYLEKDITISASHRLKRYNGACANLHGHNWKVIVFCKGNTLDDVGMLIDFKIIKEEIMKKYDHCDITELNLQGDNATAENLAKAICEQIPFCYKVSIEEQEGSRCIYVKD